MDIKKRIKEKLLDESDEFMRHRLALQANLRYVGWGHYKDSSGNSFDWDETTSKFIPKDVSKELHGHVGKQSNTTDFRHTFNNKDIVDLSKNHKEQLYLVNYKDKNNKYFSFYLKDGKYYEKTSNLNYSLNNPVKPYFPKNIEFTFKAIFVK